MTDIRKMPVNALVEKFEALKSMAALIPLYAEEIERRLRAKKEVPGYHLAPGNSTRVWIDIAKTKAYLKKLGYTVDEYSPREFLSVAQMEKLVGPGKLSKYYDKMPGKTVVKKD